MGKVKRSIYIILEYFMEYQFPMGKVKKKDAFILAYVIKYQFPMGKVKLPQSQHLTAD